jgi:hypothetical protein
MAAVREAMRRAQDNGSTFDVLVEQTSISRAGLYKFLNGAAPYTKNRKKLLKWYKQQPAGPEGPDPAAAEAELEFLAPGRIDEQSASFLLPAIAKLFEEDAKRQGANPSRWVREVLTRSSD